MELSYEISNGASKVVYYSKQNERLDSDTWKMIINNPDNRLLLPVLMNNKDGIYCFCYDIEGTVNMRAWMSEASYEEQCAMKQKIQYAKKKLIQYMIPEEEILMEEKYMYVDEDTGEVQFICIPLVKNNKKTETSVKQFSDSIPPLPEKPPVPKAENIYEEIPREPIKEKKGHWGRKKAVKEADNFWKTEKTEWEKEPKALDFPVPSLYEPISVQRVKNQEKLPKTNHSVDYSCDEEEGTTLLENDGEEGTVLLKRTPVINAKLVRSQTKEEFSVNKADCRIGKKSAVVDICLRNNPTISREHCRIIYEEGDYYIEDCNSSNFTYLEGKRVMPGEKKKLSDCSKIQISDEEFHFYINDRGDK